MTRPCCSAPARMASVGRRGGNGLQAGAIAARERATVGVEPGRAVTPVMEDTAPLAMLAVDQAEQLKVRQDLADGGPVDAELQGELALGRQLVAGRDGT